MERAEPVGDEPSQVRRQDPLQFFRVHRESLDQSRTLLLGRFLAYRWFKTILFAIVLN